MVMVVSFPWCPSWLRCSQLETFNFVGVQHQRTINICDHLKWCTRWDPHIDARRGLVWILACFWFFECISSVQQEKNPKETSSTLVYDPKLPQPSRKELNIISRKKQGDFMRSPPDTAMYRAWCFFSSPYPKWAVVNKWVQQFMLNTVKRC